MRWVFCGVLRGGVIECIFHGDGQTAWGDVAVLLVFDARQSDDACAGNLACLIISLIAINILVHDKAGRFGNNLTNAYYQFVIYQ